MQERKNLTELKRIYHYVRIVTSYLGSKKYEGVPLDENWQDFESFVKDNWFRYYRAKIKWRNYKKVVLRKGRPNKLKVNYICFKRKVKSLGYTKENTVFTSLSDATKYYETTHKYLFEDQLLGTRDIKNILKKRGISVTMETIVSRLNKGDDLFSVTVTDKIRYRGKWMNLKDIADLESIDYEVLKKRYYKKGNIKGAVDSTKKVKKLVRIEFEGNLLLRAKIFKILSDRSGIKEDTIKIRFRKHGFNYDKLLQKDHLNSKINLLKTFLN